MKLVRNFTTHNLIAHPVSEVLYLLGLGPLNLFHLRDLGNAIHNATFPEHVAPGEGRG